MSSQETADRITTSLKRVQEMSEQFELLQKRVAFISDKLDDLEYELGQLKSRENAREML
jgi:hypothetical protein